MTNICIISAFILWLVFIRRTIDPKKPLQQNTLTQKEIDWLIDTWQPEPLVPALTTKQVKMLKLTPVSIPDLDYIYCSKMLYESDY